jgi:hypothetical protein
MSLRDEPLIPSYGFVAAEATTFSNRVAHQCMSAAECGCDITDIICLGRVESDRSNMAALFCVRRSLLKSMERL